MRDSARRVLLYCSAIFLCIALLTEHAVSAQCSDIYPDAEIGPPPEWTFWGDGSACYVRWTPETSQHEDKLLEQCRNTSGARFIHFERDKGAGHSICLFKILGLIAPSKTPNPIPPTPQAEQLNEQVSSSSQAMAAIETGETPAAAPDPERLAAMAACSSTKLGDYRHCVGREVSKKQNQFTFALKPDCDNGAVAAISTIDGKARCLRKVISLSPEARSTEVESHGEPAVIDAIAFREGIYECYARRHDNISCDGKVDFDNLHRLTEHVIPKSKPKAPTARKKIVSEKASN